MAIDFPTPALPYCVFSRRGLSRRLGVGVGTSILDLHRLADRISSIDPRLLRSDRLNPLLAAGRGPWGALREELLRLVTVTDLGDAIVPQDDATLHLAWEVADYVDFYSSRHHAENVGRILRPDADPLPENWLHQPVGYHGRSSTVVVDGTPIRRPTGQRRAATGEVVVGPSERLDFELELGFVVGGATAQGEPVAVNAAAEHLFGVVLLNDWSARDIQAWEYVPLGPFLGKSFATSVSAWVMPWAALAEARRPGPPQDPVPAAYLRHHEPWALDADLEVWMRPSGDDAPTRISGVNAVGGLYWTAAQQLAHMTVNGARLTPGDLFGSGTVSGPTRGERGSLLELAWNGAEPLEVGGVERSFLLDGDEVTLRGEVPCTRGPIPLGPVTGRILKT